MGPSTWTQVFVVALFVLPGFVYRGIRSRLRGPHPDDKEATVRVLRALGVSVALGLLYVVLLGPSIALRARAPQEILDSPRSTAALALLLIFGVPALLAVLGHAVYLRSIGVVDEFRELRPRHLRIYDNTPTAWDVAFRGRDEQFVRILTSDNKWIGGLADEDAFVTAYPEGRELYLSTAYKMLDDGEFSDEVTNTAGMWVRCDDVQLVQFLTPHLAADDTAGGARDTASGTEEGARGEGLERA